MLLLHGKLDPLLILVLASPQARSRSSKKDREKLDQDNICRRSEVLVVGLLLLHPFPAPLLTFRRASL